jgi:hypothetical protein
MEQSRSARLPADRPCQGSAGYGPVGIQAHAEDSKPAAAAPAGSAGSSGDNYTYRAVPYNVLPIAGPIQVSNQGVISNPTGPGASAACPSGQTGYFVYDTQGYSKGMICVPSPTDNLPPATSPEIALAEQASSSQPWPSLTMGINPGIGLTGMPSWFWLAGGSASILDATASSGPLTITVRAKLAGITWMFGDGAGYDSQDLGHAYPAPSEIQHTYQTDTYGRQAGYTVSGVLRYAVTYSVNGGPWATLGVKVRAFNQQYIVNQLQPEAVGLK